MAATPQRRLYFALWPDEPLRAAIVAASAAAVAAAGGRAVPPADLHVTLAFLGGVPAGRAADAIVAARGIRAEPGGQMFDRLGSWPRGGPLVLETTCVAPQLGALRAALENALLAADFTLDRREFRPHITLARAPERRCATVAANVHWRYSAFVLVESHPAAAGSPYAVVETFALG